MYKKQGGFVPVSHSFIITATRYHTSQSQKQQATLSANKPENTIQAMSLFKSNKNKSTSAASTPAQTPRPSVEAQRPTQTKMTRDQAIDAALGKSVQIMPANFSLM